MKSASKTEVSFGWTVLSTVLLLTALADSWLAAAGLFAVGETIFGFYLFAPVFLLGTVIFLLGVWLKLRFIRWFGAAAFIPVPFIAMMKAVPAQSGMNSSGSSSVAFSLVALVAAGLAVSVLFFLKDPPADPGRGRRIGAGLLFVVVLFLHISGTALFIHTL